jgi:hypothetical protein
VTELRTRTTFLLAGAALLVGGARRAQARTGAAAPQGYGAIQGVVFDSLIQRALAGAQVSLLNGSRVAETDQRGRFLLDSVRAGTQVVTFSHADLDSIGLTTLAARVIVAAGRTTTVQLGVPSHETFWRAACGGDRTARDSGVVYGSVTDVRSRTRLVGAAVVVSWPAVSRNDSGRFVISHPTIRTRTDSLGTYYACGVPAEYLVTAQAFAGRSSTGTIDVLVSSRAIARKDLAVSRDTAAGADTAAGGPPRGSATVMGEVRDDRGAVVMGAYATLDDVPAGAGTERDGGFVLRHLPAGTRMLMVRHVGYFAWRMPVDLRSRDTTHVAVLMRQATVLDTIRVVASPRLTAELEDMQIRMESGFGFFLTAAEIKQHTNVRGLFETLPSVYTQGPSVQDFQILMRVATGYCAPSIFVDGLPSAVEMLPSIRPETLALVEIYPRLNPGLARYMNTSNVSECGIILIWTKYSR